jgi:hypothetical protein
MVVTPLFEEPVEVLMGADHDLARQPAIAWEMLSRFPHILFKDGYGMQRLVQQQFQDRGETFNAALELNTLDAFRESFARAILSPCCPSRPWPTATTTPPWRCAPPKRRCSPARWCWSPPAIAW